MYLIFTVNISAYKIKRLCIIFASFSADPAISDWNYQNIAAKQLCYAFKTIPGKRVFFENRLHPGNRRSSCTSTHEAIIKVYNIIL